MTGRAFIISMATVVVVGIVGTVMLRPDPAPLPPKIVKQLETKLVRDAVDSAARVHLEGEVTSLRRQVDRLTSEARAKDSAAGAEHSRGDSLGAAAAASATAADSARRYEAAFVSRSIEVDTLRAGAAKRDSLIEDQFYELLDKDEIISIETGRRQRADSAVHALVDNATDGDHCRIPGTFGLVHCPSRKATAGAGVVVGILGTAIATGKIRIPIRF